MPGTSAKNRVRLSSLACHGGAVLDYLERWLTKDEARGLTGRVIELAVLEALTLDVLGEIDGAMDDLRRALTLVEPPGYVCVFARVGRSSRTESVVRAGALGIRPTSGRGASLGS